MNAPPLRPRSAAWASAWVLGLTLLVQLALQSWFFPASALFDGRPLLHIDSPFHQYQMEAARQLCIEGESRGYDPAMAAGSLVGTAVNASAKPQAWLACVADRWLGVADAYKLVSFVQGVLAPALIVAAALMLRLGPLACAAAGLLALLCWWTGGLRWYHTAGMVQYTFSAFLTVPFVVAFVLMLRQPSLLGVLACAAVAAFGMFVHPLFPVGALLAGGCWVLLEPVLRTHPLRSVALLILVSAAMLALNAGWVAASIGRLGGSPYSQPYQQDVVPLLVLREMAGIASTAGGGLRLGVALLLCALYAWFRSEGEARRWVRALVLGALALMLWASIGALWPSIARLQPNRFSSLAWLMLVPPAAAGLAMLAGRLHQGWRQVGWRWYALATPIGLVLLVGLRDAGKEIFAPAGAGRYAVAPPEVKGEGPLFQQLATFLREQTTADARVLFEMSRARVHDGAHIAGRLAQQTGRDFIGGPYPYFDFASAWDGFALGPHEGRSPARLAELLDLYNVRWMICHSQSCQRAMAELADVQQAARIGTLVAYARSASPGPVISGEARVLARCVNRVELQRQGAGPVVLRYHWLPGLRAEPAGRVEPVSLAPGARPFVAVHDAPESFALRVGSGPGVPCAERPPAADAS